MERKKVPKKMADKNIKQLSIQKVSRIVTQSIVTKIEVSKEAFIKAFLPEIKHHQISDAFVGIYSAEEDETEVDIGEMDVDELSVLWDPHDLIASFSSSYDFDNDEEGNIVVVIQTKEIIK